MSDRFDLTAYNGPDTRPTSSTGGISRPKAPSVQRASPARWREIRAAKLGPCYVCRWLGVEQTYDSTLHHLVSKSLRGSDTEANCVPLCGDGTRGHHGDVEAHRAVACRALAAAVQAWDDAAYSYAIGKLGEDGFLRRYKVRFGPAGKFRDAAA